MKNKVLNSSFGIGNIVFIAALIIALPLRVYQYLSGVIEPVTGFFATNNFSVVALYGVIALSAVAVIALGFVNRKKLAYEINTQKNPLLGTASAIAALSIILDAVFNIDIVGMLEAGAPDATTSPEQLTTYYVVIAQAAVSIIAALFFAVLCANSFMGKTLASEFRLLSLAPVLWSMLRMIARFMRTISFVRVSELLFEMFMLAFMIMFFMNFAQCNSKVNDKDCAWKLAAYGLPASLLALVCFVPREILLIAGKRDIIYAGSVTEFSDLAVALFVVATVLTKLTADAPEATVAESAETDDSKAVSESADSTDSEADGTTEKETVEQKAEE